mmetsp:Transcript_8439/g.23456  ORF Transcript_8439/g.23456 Transcript_8439/m.23456 type:complete len:224 (-) Transcript_8439:160-831(-)
MALCERTSRQKRRAAAPAVVAAPASWRSPLSSGLCAAGAAAGRCRRAAKAATEGRRPQSTRACHTTSGGTEAANRHMDRAGASMEPIAIISTLTLRRCPLLRRRPAWRKQHPSFPLPSVMETGHSPPMPTPSRKRHKPSWYARPKCLLLAQQADKAHPRAVSAAVARLAALWPVTSARTPKPTMPSMMPTYVMLAMKLFCAGWKSSGYKWPKVVMMRSTTAMS